MLKLASHERNIEPLGIDDAGRVRTEIVSPIRAAIRAGTYDDAGPNLDAAIVEVLSDVVGDDLPEPVPNGDGVAHENFGEPGEDARTHPHPYDQEFGGEDAHDAGGQA